jgi:protein translocase SecG subunit
MTLLASILPWLQIALAVLLVAGILIQRGEEGLGSAFGGSSGGGVSYSKRGIEKQIFIATIIIAVLFIVTSVVSLLI